MSAEVGTAVSDVLERAAKRHIKHTAPELYDEFLFQIHGAGKVRHYDGSDVYWRRVQAAMDFFFTSEQRAEICRCLMQRTNLERRPECRNFQASAVAEARMRELLAGMPPSVLSGRPVR